MHRSVLDAVELAEKGYRAQKIKDILEKNREHMVIYVGLSTLTISEKGWTDQFCCSCGSRCAED